MSEILQTSFPPVALWRINAMRFTFLLMAVVMGGVVWNNLLFHSQGVPVTQGLSRSMLGGLALMALLGVRYPMQMLPLMLYEMAWKTVWLTMIALRAWLDGQWTADIGELFRDCIGIVVAYVIVPWPYIRARYIRQPMEPLLHLPV